MRENAVSTDGDFPGGHDWNNGPWSLNYFQGDETTGTVRLAVGESSTTGYPHELRITVEESTVD